MNLFVQFKQTLAKYGLEYFNKYYSLYEGVVYDNADPENQGRIVLKVPSIYGNTALEKWARPRGMFIGKQKGLFAIPAIGDSVWVSFLNGDPRFPVWEYGWTEDSPNAVTELGQTNGVVLVVEDGKRIVIKEDGIFISDGTDTEPAVLGNTAVELLKELIDDIGNLSAIQTNTGITSTINSSPLWAALVSKWNTKLEELKAKTVNVQ